MKYILMCVVAIAAMALPVGIAAQTTLSILHSSDGESALLANDYSGSVAQFAAVVKSEVAKSGRDNTLVVSSGDNYLAGIEYAASQGRYDAEALNLAGVDVSAIGNHEFDFGTEGFAAFVEAAEFPLVSTNLRFNRVPELSPYINEKLFPAMVIEKSGTKIGIVGATTESISYISSPGAVGILDVEKTLNIAVKRLQSNHGVDIIIALTHLQNIEEEKALAERIEGIDVFVAGGGDDLIGNSNNRYLVRTNRSGDRVADEPTGAYPYRTTTPANEPVVVVSTDGSYNYLGRLDLTFNDEGIITAVGDGSGPIPITPNSPVDRAVQRNIVEPVEAAISGFATDEVGVSTDGLNGTRGDVRTRETTLGNAVTDGYLYTLRKNGEAVDFAFTNGGGIRRSVVVQAGQAMTRQELLTALPFANYLTIVKGLTAGEIKDIFEHSVSELPGAGGRFLQVSGIQVQYDSSRPVGSRVREITIEGHKLVEAGKTVSRKRFTGVTNSFLAGGGDGYERLGNIPNARKSGSGTSYADGFEKYLEDNSPISSPIEGRLVDLN